LDRFADVGRADIRFSGQVRDRPADLENAVVGPGAQTELRHGRFQEPLPFLADRAEALDVARAHPGIGEDLAPLEARELALAGRAHAFPDLLGALGLDFRHDIPEPDLGDFELDIDPVEERARDLGVVPASLSLRAVGLVRAQALENVLACLCCLSVV
jgi:hypothetical protein